ncbi:MAG TPA: DUF2911 domain-containing protein [Terriglobales bacterium]|nr:DUF2911 domain-containing protein [Terriglobales bacterium]
MRKLTVVVLPIVLLAAAWAFAQQPDKSKRPSPPGTATVSFADGKKITVDYSRPKINDPKTGQPRKIFGTLVPYDKEWRTGANEATTFVTDTNVKVGDLSVPAGSYTLYTIPGESEWTIIINKQTGQWGTVYNQAQDLGRTKVKSEKTPSTVEQFTISFDPAKGKSTKMNLEWENTKVSVPIEEQ